MLKFVLPLVLLLTVCEAAVIWLGKDKPTGFGDVKGSPSKPELQVYCAQSRRTVHCLEFGSLKKYSVDGAEYKGKSAAFVYNDADCSLSIDRIKTTAFAYLLMDTCDDIYGINISNDGQEIEANLKEGKGNKNWRHCVQQTCNYKRSSNVAKTTWKPLPKPEQGQGNTDISEIPLESEVPVTSDIPVTSDVPITSESDETEITIFDENDNDDDDGDADDIEVSFHTPQNRPMIYCDKGAYSCLSCSAVRVCFPTRDMQHFYEVERHNCPKINPYCDYSSGSCSKSPDPACYDPPSIDKANNFNCMRDGFFPDPKDCSKFYVCKDHIAYVHYCPRSPVPYYHPGTRICQQSKKYCADKTSSGLCRNQRNFGRKIAIKYTNNYFMYCGMNKKVLSIDKCDGAYRYDKEAQMCVFDCPHVGNFLCAEDCTKFYRCSPLRQGGFKKTLISCPAGQAFLEAEFQCVERARVPKCNNPFVDSMQF